MYLLESQFLHLEKVSKAECEVLQVRKKIQYIVEKKTKKDKTEKWNGFRQEHVLEHLNRLVAALIFLITIQVILYNRRVYLQFNTSHSFGSSLISIMITAFSKRIKGTRH